MSGEGFACFRWAFQLYHCATDGPMDIDSKRYAVWRWNCCGRMHR